MTISEISNTCVAIGQATWHASTHVVPRLLIACDGKYQDDVNNGRQLNGRDVESLKHHQQDGPRYFMLLEQVESGEQDNSATVNDMTTHPAGTLWCADQPELIRSDRIILRSPKGTDTKSDEVIIADQSILKELSLVQYDSLLAISNPSDRTTVCLSNEWLDDAVNIKVGNAVHVHLPHAEPMTGRVEYIGHLVGRNGRWFGVALDEEFYGRGSTEGAWRRKLYFHCPENSGVFVNLRRIRTINKRDSGGEQSPCDSAVVTDNVVAVKSSVVIGDRVVYFTEGGLAEYATAKYVGFLPGKNSVLYVGVEFDSAIGKGNGMFKGVKLFEAKSGHASLIPMIGLIKAEELESERIGTASGASANIDDSGVESFPTDAAKLAVAPNDQTHKKRAEYAEFQVGTRVECLVPARYGVIRWLGRQSNEDARSDPTRQRLVAGIELEEPDTNLCTGGEFEGQRRFSCAPGHALFLRVDKLRLDRRQELVDYLQDALANNVDLNVDLYE